jgi:hypothetical protein
MIAVVCTLARRRVARHHRRITAIADARAARAKLARVDPHHYARADGGPR